VELKFTAVVVAYATLAYIVLYMEVMNMASYVKLGIAAFGGSIGVECMAHST